jgi:hypothetical protein
VTGFAWGALLVCGVVSGLALCAAIVSPRPLDRMYWALTLLFAVVGTGSFLVLSRTSGRLDSSIAALFLDLGAALGGFALGAALLPTLTRPRSRREAPDPTGTGTGTGSPLCVVVLADAEPELYDPVTVTVGFADLEDADVPVPPEAARVFAYVAEKARYSSVGLSPSRPTVTSVASSLDLALRERGISADVTVAFCVPPLALGDVVAARAESGTPHIVVVTLGPAKTRTLEGAERTLSLSRLRDTGTAVSFASALWSSECLAREVADRIVGGLAGGISPADGVVLACPGQPWQWDESHPDATAHETYFCQRVRADLIELGVKESSIRTAYLDWQEPDIEEAVRHLAATGCARVVVAPATAPFESLETLVDLPMTLRHAAEGTGIAAIAVPAWGDTPEVARALADAVEETLADTREDLGSRP